MAQEEAFTAQLHDPFRYLAGAKVRIAPHPIDRHIRSLQGFCIPHIIAQMQPSVHMPCQLDAFFYRPPVPMGVADYPA